MAFVLTIDTALDRGSVGFFRDNIPLGIFVNETQKDHAGFVQSAIDQLVKDTCTSLESLDGIAVVNGPGSYTGLRVGLATAKGLCYALDKKLILLNTLEVMALSCIQYFKGEDYNYVPMIDARREDVFSGVYNNQRMLIQAHEALTLSPDTFLTLSREKKIAINGSGAAKATTLLKNKNLLYWEGSYAVEDINTIAQEKFSSLAFANIAYSEPLYLKAFYSTAKVQQ